MYVQLCLAIPRMQNDMVIQGRRKMIKVRGLNGGCEPPLGGSRGMPRAKFFSLKHVFLHLGVRFGIELGQRKIQSSSAQYISAPCVLNVCNCAFT
jgi:hypothetical protein